MTQTLFDTAEMSGAIISPCGQYRYLLWRQWDESLPELVWIMLNPSTADANTEDPTLRKCIGFAKRWGYGSIKVLNLYAYRATDPDELSTALNPVGDLNREYWEMCLQNKPDVIIAWGAHKSIMGFSQSAMWFLKNKEIQPYALGLTKHTRQPLHPLYVAYDTERITISFVQI